MEYLYVLSRLKSTILNGRVVSWNLVGRRAVEPLDTGGERGNEEGVVTLCSPVHFCPGVTSSARAPSEKCQSYHGREESGWERGEVKLEWWKEGYRDVEPAII